MRARIYLTVGLLAAMACSDDVLMRANEPVNGLFQRYVSVGNSITAGFQSGGINETSQAQSYAVLLAGQMDTEFFVPYMKNPGCPPPYANVFTQTRIDPTTCALRRQESFPPPYMNNVAVPGAEVIDAVNNLDPASNANQLTQFMLGGLTQIQMLQRVDPTFVSVWLGNNDVLGSATNSSDAGNPALVTPPATFAERYDGVLDAIQATSPGGVILIGVPNVTVIPYFSLGQVYFALKNQPSSPFPPTFTVGPNCAPSSLGGKGDSVLVPFPFGGTLLAQAALGNAVTLSCTEAQTVQPSELINLVSTVTAYNQTIVSEATARNWGYYDPNPALDSLRALPAEVAPFPNFGTPPAFTPCDQNPFGLAFSCDAVHPSARTHKLIANKISQAINAKYGTSLAQIP